MTAERAVVVAADMVTPYGRGTEALWRGLGSGKSAIGGVTRFSTTQFPASTAGIVPGLRYHGGESLVLQMLRPLLADARGMLPREAKLILATTKGEIDLLEQAVLTGQGSPDASRLDCLLRMVASLAGVEDEGMVISAACASSSAAAAHAAALIREGQADCAVIFACDAVTEFVYSGFASLMALDPSPARPFDRDRKGLSVGEAAAYMLIMSAERARREGRTVLGSIAGWGLSDDANHMTGPSRTSEGLLLAVRKALRSAGVAAEDIGCISAHGTGTVYNDAMEMRAFRTVFSGAPVPVYSVKGGIGHTMGAAGLVEIIIALRALRERVAPPTVNLVHPDTDAEGWASGSSQPLDARGAALITNAGFSGINTAVVVQAGP